MVNPPLVAAGSLAVLGSAVHGVGGEVLVMRRLSPEPLPPTRFGGPRTTRAMIHTTWHLTTAGLLATGIGLLVAGAALRGETPRGAALLAAGASTGFAAVTVGFATAYGRSPRALLRHPAPAILTAAAALAWRGALRS